MFLGIDGMSFDRETDMSEKDCCALSRRNLLKDAAAGAVAAMVPLAGAQAAEKGKMNLSLRDDFWATALLVGQAV